MLARSALSALELLVLVAEEWLTASSMALQIDRQLTDPCEQAKKVIAA